MGVAVLKQFDLTELREMYDHAAALSELLDGQVGHTALRTQLAGFIDRLEWELESRDPLVDRQPAIVADELLSVVPA